MTPLLYQAALLCEKTIRRYTILPMPMKVREVVRLLEQNGWLEDSARYTQNGRIEMTTKRYSIVIEPSSTGYSAYSPDVLGCVSAGATEEETRANFQDALTSHFEVMRELGEPIPEPHVFVDYVEVAA